MIVSNPDALDIFLLEDAVWIAEEKIRNARYDFDFSTFLACRRPYDRPQHINAVGRFGVTDEYDRLFVELQNRGVKLVHDPHQHWRASDLRGWYPRVSDITPRSRWYEAIPTAEEVEHDFAYPIFIKGSRQTNRHKAVLSIANTRTEYLHVATAYRENSVLHWQPFVVREFVKLRKVTHATTDKIPPSFEFRTFWWKQELVGWGRYWADFSSYECSEVERAQACAVVRAAAIAVDVPFLVVDVAQAEDGRWIVIECNDGQESGYAGANPLMIWQRIVALERAR